jgi:hypothetical protein
LRLSRPNGRKFKAFRRHDGSVAVARAIEIGALSPDRKPAAEIVDDGADRAGNEPAADQAEYDGGIDAAECRFIDMGLPGEMGHTMSRHAMSRCTIRH